MKSVFTKKIVALSLLTVLVCGFLVAPMAQAATATTDAPGDMVSGFAAKPIFGAITVSAFVVNGVLSFVAAVTGELFDMAVNFSIVNIKEFFDGTGIVNTLWTFIRDLVNISFIFILLYLAITKIMGSWGVKQKTTVVNVIISAIFINFSMVVAKLCIDAGNVVAVELYKAIAGSNLSTSISTLFMRNTDLSNLITDWKLTSQIQTISNLMLNIGALGWLIYLFFYCSILFIGRAVMLLFLVISSPIAFMVKTIPFLDGLSETWWTTLTDQIILAPLVMFLLYVTIKVTQHMNFSNINLDGGTDVLQNVGKFFAFILVLVLLSQTIKIAKKYSGEVGKIAVKAAKGAAIAAGVVVGAVATGGVSLAAGASTLAGAAGAGADAAAAGKTGLDALGARLQFSGKQIANSKIGKGVMGAFNTAGKFASGDLGEQPGVVGFAARKARTGLFKVVKDTTGLDVVKYEKEMKENKKLNETKILAGVQKKVTTVQTITAEIKDQAKKQTEREQGVQKESLIADHTIKEKTFKAEQEKAKKDGTDIFKEPSPEYAKAESDFNAVDQKLKEFKGKENKLVVDLAQKRKAEWQNLIGDILEKNEKTGEMTLEADKEIADTIREREAQIIEGYSGGIKEWFGRGISTGLWSKKAGKNVAVKARKGLTGEKSVKEIIEEALKKENEKSGGAKTPKPATKDDAENKEKVQSEK